MCGKKPRTIDLDSPAGSGQDQDPCPRMLTVRNGEEAFGKVACTFHQTMIAQGQERTRLVRTGETVEPSADGTQRADLGLWCSVQPQTPAGAPVS